MQSCSQKELKSLARICLARSGDKGDSVNIGVLARGPKSYEYLKQNLTAQTIKNMFQELCHGRVVRYELDTLWGLNFILEESLGEVVVVACELMHKEKLMLRLF